MLEFGFDQAQGLVAWELQPPTRVLPVVAGEDESARRDSLELVWALEQGCQRLGLPVVVIDGLNGLLPRDALLGHAVVMRRWLQDVPPGSVVLWHAPLDAMAALLADSVARPLLALRADKQAMVQAYQAVKILWQAAGLVPIVVQADHEEPAAAERAAQAFSLTCERALSVVPSLWRLEYDEQQPTGRWNRPQNDASLLKVLDSALMIEDSGNRQHVDQRYTRSLAQADQIVGVSDVHRQRHAGP